MSDPKEPQATRDELDLEPEQLADLELADDDADDVRGGKCVGTAPGLAGY
jgi:hypothetical protein